jgi:hypothetical protein
MGWQSGQDTGDLTQSAASTLCAEIMKKGGQPFDNSNGAPQCEFMFFLQHAFDEADIVSPAGFGDGVGRLGTSHSDPYTVGGRTEFTPGDHEGPGAVRAVAYDPKCNCPIPFKYVSEPEPFPE